MWIFCFIPLVKWLEAGFMIDNYFIGAIIAVFNKKATHCSIMVGQDDSGVTPSKCIEVKRIDTIPMWMTVESIWGGGGEGRRHKNT